MTPSRVIFNVELGRRIRARREELGLGLNELSERAEMSGGQLSMVENGLRGLTLWTAASLAAALEWSLDQLMEGVRQ